MFFLEDRDAKLDSNLTEAAPHSEDAPMHSKEKNNSICPVPWDMIRGQKKKGFLKGIHAGEKIAAWFAAKGGAESGAGSGKAGSFVAAQKADGPVAALLPKREKWRARIWRELKPQLFAGAISLVLVIGLCVGVNVSDFHLGYEVLVDGETLGLVTDTRQVDEAIRLAQEEIWEYMGKDTAYSKEPVYIRRIVSGKEAASAEDMKNRLLVNVNYMVECCGIFIDGKAQVGLTTPEAANWVLDRYKAQFTDPAAVELDDVAFCEQVETKQDFLHIALLRTPEEALAMLNDAAFHSPVTYTTTDDDTLEGVSAAYGVSVEKIMELNPTVQPECLTGGVCLALESPVPLLTVRSVQTVELTEAIPREVQQVEDDTLYRDTTVVSQEGEDGESRVVAKITKMNNAEQSREVLSRETTKEPIAKVERVGTLEPPPTTGSGSFLKPALGSLSSRFGSRWGRHHNGIDIAGSTNSDILAADGGVVTYAGWMSGYGNYVVINHENGYETAYGHNNSIVVSVGDRVAKGDVIAKMGSTGQSTGPHCHFEVKKDGVFQNPLDFVSY